MLLKWRWVALILVVVISRFGASHGRIAFWFRPVASAKTAQYQQLTGEQFTAATCATCTDSEVSTAIWRPYLSKQRTGGDFRDWWLGQFLVPQPTRESHARGVLPTSLHRHGCKLPHCVIFSLEIDQTLKKVTFPGPIIRLRFRVDRGLI